MNRDEFLNQLRLALNGEVPVEVIEENVKYYEEYILTEIRKGRTEEEVFEELGDPRLLAKTIADMQQGNARVEDVYEEKTSGDFFKKLPGVVTLILIAVVAIAITTGIGAILVAILPYLVPVVLLLIVIRYIKNNF